MGCRGKEPLLPQGLSIHPEPQVIPSMEKDIRVHLDGHKHDSIR